MRRSILILFFFLLASCNERERALPTEPVPQQPSTASVGGRVLSLQTGQPVANTVVSFTSPFDVVSTTMTDADGRYTLTGLQADLYSVTAAGQRAGIVRLALGANQRDVFVTADARCVVQYGTVRDARTARPVAGAKVTIFGREATTDADGRYSIDFGCSGTVAGSTIVVTVAASGYQSLSTTTRASFLCTCSWDFALEPR